MLRQARCARDDFYRDGNLWAPLWLIENVEGRTMLLATPTQPTDDKDKLGDIVRKAIKEWGGVRYAYAAESWFYEQSPDGYTGPPRSAPNRREALWISGEDINGEQRTMVYEIKRRPGGKPKLDKVMRGGEFSGRFADMFAAGPYL
jgi:hypothetical protein